MSPTFNLSQVLKPKMRQCILGVRLGFALMREPRFIEVENMCAFVQDFWIEKNHATNFCLDESA